MSFTTGNDINILQSTDLPIVGAGEGNDRYVLDVSTLSPNQKITLSDTKGVNILQLADGLVIVSLLTANDALQITLDNGAVITVLGASNFKFQTGGNPLNGTGGTIQTYADFAARTYFQTGLTRPNIDIRLINEDQYDAAYAQGLRGDAMLPLAGVFFWSFKFILNSQQVDLTKEIMNQEGTYSQAVTAINAALDKYKVQFPNNIALQTVRAELGAKFQAGTREGTSILMTADPVIGAAGSSRSGTNMFEADGIGLQLGSMAAHLTTFPNTNLYERVSCNTAGMKAAK